MKYIIHPQPRLFNWFGHQKSLIDSIQKYAKKSGHTFFCYVPKICTLRHTSFKYLLSHPRKKEKTLWGIYFLLQDFWKICRKTKHVKSRIFVFDDFYTKMFFCILFMAMFFTRRSDHFLLIFRYAPSEFFLKGRFHAFIIHQMRSRFELLTDSLSIQKKIHIQWKLSSKILPMSFSPPHKIKQQNPSNPIICWWPGFYRPEKGKAAIDHIAKNLPKNFLLKASQDAHLPNTISLPNYLSKEEYATHMKMAHLIFLPYQGKRYVDSTSNIFVESILNQKISFVSENTWMAFELIRFDLNELIVDWYREDFFHYIKKIYHHQKTHEKLAKMCDEYRQFYSEKNVEKALQDCNFFG